MLFICLFNYLISRKTLNYFSFYLRCHRIGTIFTNIITCKISVDINTETNSSIVNRSKENVNPLLSIGNWWMNIEPKMENYLISLISSWKPTECGFYCVWSVKKPFQISSYFPLYLAVSLEKKLTKNEKAYCVVNTVRYLTVSVRKERKAIWVNVSICICYWQDWYYSLPSSSQAKSSVKDPLFPLRKVIPIGCQQVWYYPITEKPQIPWTPAIESLIGWVNLSLHMSLPATRRQWHRG